MRGLMRGLNAGECKDSASPSYFEGWDIGRDSRARADEIRLGCAETGRIGGTRRAANAQANAQANASPDASPNGKPVAQPERRTKNEELGTKERKPKEPKRPTRAEEIYDAYPKKAERPDAIKGIEIALKVVSFDSLLAAVQEYAKAVSGWPADELQFVPSCGRWMKKERWLDDRTTWIKKPKTNRNGAQHNGFNETDYTAGLDSVPRY